jgi:hypothetical protein
VLTKKARKGKPLLLILASQDLVYVGIRDQQKITLLQRARAFASESISARELEEARLGKNAHVLIAAQHTLDQFL